MAGTEVAIVASIGVLDLVSSRTHNSSTVELRVHIVPREVDVVSISASLLRSGDSGRSSGKNCRVGVSEFRAQRVAAGIDSSSNAAALSQIPRAESGERDGASVRPSVNTTRESDCSLSAV